MGILRDDSLNHQTGAWAASLAESELTRLPFGAELQLDLDLIPAHTWYAVLSGALTFLNERGSDYLGLSKDHPIRLGIDTGAAWDSLSPS